jgi:hypothetical protein
MVSIPFTIAQGDERMTHRVPRVGDAAPEMAGLWDGAAWREAPTMAIDRFHGRSSDHRPAVHAKLLHDARALFALFVVEDRWVRCRHTEYDSDTYKDSCVEVFLQPAGRVGYFALEVNCGGAFSLRYIEDPARTANRFARWTRVDWAQARRIRVARSMPDVVEPEEAGPVTWWIELAWPVDVMEACCGALGSLGGQRWRANLFKCGDETSHPHWASWAPIGEALNFHAPEYFGALEFA